VIVVYLCFLMRLLAVVVQLPQVLPVVALEAVLVQVQ
jgi:hypothetical protein